MSGQAFAALFGERLEKSKAVVLAPTACRKCGTAGKYPICVGCLRNLKHRKGVSR